jgi:nifR3 family TIM-barrel protein
MNIGNIKISSNMFLAPMAGVTDVGFRKLAKEFGAGLTYTEMISAKGLLFNNLKTSLYLITAENEIPKAVQIFGSDKNVIARVVQDPLLNKFDIIDLNMGCPAPKIVKNGEGCALMKNERLAFSIINECVKFANRPVTVKFRTGFDQVNINAVSFAKMCEEAGASAITVHGRTREQMYSGTVDYDAIAKVKASVNIPVIGNGDIIDEKSLQKMKDTKVDAFMIGRGALGRPWIFSELCGSKPKVDRIQTVKSHIDELKKHYREKWITLHMRKHFLWYLKYYPLASDIKREIIKIDNINDSFDAFASFIKENNI